MALSLIPQAGMFVKDFPVQLIIVIYGHSHLRPIAAEHKSVLAKYIGMHNENIIKMFKIN